MNNPNSWKNWSNDDWANWLELELKKRKIVFVGDAVELIGSFNREKTHAREYHGTELYELIQNADDSGINYGSNKLLIKLTEIGLFIANTGIPFSPEGIKSLMVCDTSPKQFLRTNCIGYKGLGFRAVLGWTSSIIIFSGKLSIGFNEKFALNWLQTLMKKNPDVDSKVKEFKQNSGTYPTPILSIPYLLSSENIKEDNELNKIYDEGQKILESGYDTVVCLLFKDAKKTIEQVQKQINTLGSESLLFLQNLEKIEIQSPERNECLKIERKENEIIVNPKTDKSKCWKIFKKEGSIPKEYLKPEQQQNDKYEVKVAIPTEPIEFNRLFVFFPTEVRFPFPIIAHATFEVGENRQNLIKSEANRFIAEELANLMTESAEKIKDINNPWYALSTISSRGDIDPVLEKFDFLGMLIKSIKKYALLPVRNKKFEFVEKSRIIDGNFDNLLTDDTFHDLCIYTEDEFVKQRLTSLGVNHIEYEDLKKRLNEISSQLNLNQRCEIIHLLVENDLIQGEAPNLLIDENNNIIPSESSIFAPTEGKKFSLPNWVPQKILNSNLTSLLRDIFQVSRVRELILKLQPFNVQEYNMNTLISSMQAETNRRCKDKPENESILRQETIQAIWKLYSSSEEKIKLEKISIILPTRNGKFESAKNLYFGKEYKNGKILEYLYGHIDPDSFIAEPQKLGFVDNSDEIENFLSWLGVNKSPRYTELNDASSIKNFQEHVIFSLQYPAKFTYNEIIENIKELKRCHKNLKDVITIDRLEKVLTTSDPHAIICWIATNPDIELWRLEGDKDAKFEISPPRKVNYRILLNQNIPSYPLWLLRNTKWLPIDGGDKLAPNKCCLAHGAKDISPVIGFPAVNMEHPLIKELNLDSTSIKNALIKIGVVTDLNELSWDSFYEVLIELSNLDPEGTKAKSIYRKLFARSETDINPSGKKYDEFMVNGKMLGEKDGEVSYYPINKLFYLENITLPPKIAEQYPLLKMDKRRGASKVKKLFGVEPFTRDKIQIEIPKFEEHQFSKDFQDEIERIKPYIYALCVEEDVNQTKLNALRKLRIILCKSVIVTMLVDNEKKEIILDNNDTINVDSEAYLVADPLYNKSFLEDDFIADSIGEIVSNVLKVDLNDKISRIVRCPDERLLDKIAGGSGKERLEKSKELFESPPEETTFSQPSIWTPPIIDSKEKMSGSPTKIEILTQDQSEVGPVSITHIGSITPSPKRIIVRKVQQNPRIRNVITSKRRLGPNRAENLAMSFEVKEGRFPLLTSHIRGLESYGCDIISFKSENDKNSFMMKNEINLIERFIEVKGSSEKGSVVLKGNELLSAQQHKEKFFIYRIYEDENNDVYILLTLNNPLEPGNDAIKHQYEINPYQSFKSDYWELKEEN